MSTGDAVWSRGGAKSGRPSVERGGRRASDKEDELEAGGDIEWLKHTEIAGPTSIELGTFLEPSLGRAWARLPEGLSRLF